MTFKNFFLFLIVSSFLFTGCRQSELTGARRAFSKKDFHQSRLDYRAIERQSLLYGKRFKTLLGQAWAAYAEGRYRTTVEICDRLLSDYTRTRLDDWVRLLKGFALFSRRDYRRAAVSFRQVREFSGSLFVEDAVFMEGRALEETGDYKTAVARFELFLKKYHTPIYYRDALYSLWRSYERLGNTPKTYDVLKTYLKKFPMDKKNPALVLRLGDMAIAMKRPEDAILHYRDYLSVANKDDTTMRVLYWLGKEYESRGMDKPARRNFQELIRTFPENPHRAELLLWQGLDFGRRHRYRAALIVFSTLIKKYPGSAEFPRALFFRGRLLEQSGDTRHALLDYAEYLTLEPDGEFFTEAEERINAHQ